MSYLFVLLRWLGWHTVISLSLLCLAVTCVIWQLTNVIHGLDVALLLAMALLSMLSGWLLAKSRLSFWQACVTSSTLGIAAICFRVGQLGGQLFALLGALVNGSAQMWRSWLNADATPVLNALSDLWLAFATLLVRVRDWLFAWASGQPTFDPVASAIVWSLIVWAISAWAAWAIRRREQPLAAFVPSALLLCTILFYTNAYPFTLLVSLGITLVLMALLAQRLRERHWQNAAIDFSEDIKFEVALTAALLAIMLVLLAALVPSISLQDAFRFARGLAGPAARAPGPFTGWLGSDQSAPKPSPFEGVRAGGLPRQHLLGSGPELSKQVVMLIQTNDSPNDQTPRYYWRSLSYERYTGRGWYADPIDTITQKAGVPLVEEELPAHRLVQQEVQVVGEAGGFLYVAGLLSSADHDYQVARRADGDVFGALIETRAYRAESFMPVAGEAALRASGSHYPEWVRNRYLALPDDTPSRVLSLARDLTATEPNTYDRARAIERYIRSFPYTLDLPEPPPNRDVADYFLFDLKKGYCDYDATAMVVLARAAGLPARLVTGYTSGTYDATSARYRVTAADAHSWAEVYFVGYGWIEFEPTGGRPPLKRPDETPSFPPTEVRTTPHVTLISDIGWYSLVWLSLSILIGFGIGCVAWIAGVEWRLRHTTTSAAVRAIYQQLYNHAMHLDVPIRDGDTPYEIISALTSRVEELSERTHWQRMLEPTAQQLYWLTELYVLAIFSQHGLDVFERGEVLAVWRRVRRSLWLARLMQMQGVFSAFRRNKRRGASSV